MPRNRRTFSNPSTTCVCSECKVVAESIPGRTHRKCGRTNGKARVITNSIPPVFRGTWKKTAA
jgi:hypothetical protein